MFTLYFTFNCSREVDVSTMLERSTVLLNQLQLSLMVKVNVFSKNTHHFAAFGCWNCWDLNFRGYGTTCENWLHYLNITCVTYYGTLNYGKISKMCYGGFTQNVCKKHCMLFMNFMLRLNYSTCSEVMIKAIFVRVSCRPAFF